MPLPTTINDLSKTAGSNFPQGTDSPSGLDDTQRAHASFIAQLRDGDHVAAATAKTTLVDADFFPMNDSAASNILKKITWANIKAALAGLYQPVGSYATSGAITGSGLTQATARLLGRTTASSGAVEEISVGSALDLNGGSINVKTGGVTPAMLSQPVVELTAVATTSGTSVSFTSFASTAKVIELDFNQVSESAGNAIRIQLGTSGGLVASGYVGSNAAMTGGGYGGVALTSGIDFRTNAIGAGARISGHLRITHMGGNLWAYSGLCHDTANIASYTVGGTIQLGAALTQVSVLANGGTFDGPAGSSVGGRYF